MVVILEVRIWQQSIHLCASLLLPKTIHNHEDQNVHYKKNKEQIKRWLPIVRMVIKISLPTSDCNFHPICNYD